MTLEELKEQLQKNLPIKEETFSAPQILNFKTFQIDSARQIVFEGCVFKDRFYFINLEFLHKKVLFKNCKFIGSNSINFDSVKCDMLSFKDCDFESLFIENLHVEEISINNCQVNKRLNVYDSKIGYFEIDCLNNRCINDIVFDSKEIEEINLFSYNKSISKIYLNGFTKCYLEGDINSITVNANQFNTLQIKSWLKENEYVDSKIEFLIISNLNFEGIISLENITIETFKLDEINCIKGGIWLNEVKVKNTNFVDCNISSFHWNQLKFNSPPEIIRCDLSGLKLTNVSWPKGKRLKNSFLDERIPLFYSILLGVKLFKAKWNSENIIELQYQRDTYRQLKAASIENNNQIEALDFYRNEMRLYWKEIRINGGVNWHNRTLIFLYRWSSDFGQNWFLPVIWIFLFHGFFYSCILDWAYFLNNLTGDQEFSEYLKLINPAHALPNYINTSAGTFTDLIMRVSSGYFIYHIIKSTRKYGRL